MKARHGIGLTLWWPLHTLKVVLFISIACSLPIGSTSTPPDGCKVTKNTAGKNVKCIQTSLNDIFVFIKEIGDDLVRLEAYDCVPILLLPLNSSCFENNRNLRFLVIDSCSVEGIDSGTFRENGLLKKLYLMRNMIYKINTESMTELANLTVLDLSFNLITVIKNGTFQKLTSLKDLSLEDNKIQEKVNPDIFKGLGNLTTLRLQHNIIRTISNTSFQYLTSLTDLNLDYNYILSIEPGAFQNNKMLRSVTLDGNTLALLYTASFFSNLTHLKSVFMKGMDINRLDRSRLSLIFKDQAMSLERLILTGSQFGNKHLQTISKLNRLVDVNLDDNFIGYLEGTPFAHFSNRTNLSLINNKILYIDAKVFAGMRVGSVKLRTNPLHCSCRLWSFAQWLHSDKGVVVVDRENVTCGGPIGLFGTRVMDYDPYWWQCSPYVPLVALVFIVGFLLLVASIVLIFYCNRVNIKYFLIERREIARNFKVDVELDETAALPPTGTTSNIHPGLSRNSLRQGNTGAYIIYDMYETAVLTWVNKYLEDQLFGHPMKITLQWSAGPEVIPLWKQVKDFSVQVNAFLVIVTDEFLEKHWQQMAEKSGIENVLKCVFVVFGKKKSDLPREMTRLRCPRIHWPETGGTRFTTLERERAQFWKMLRIELKGMA